MCLLLLAHRCGSNAQISRPVSGQIRHDQTVTMTRMTHADIADGPSWSASILAICWPTPMSRWVTRPSPGTLRAASICEQRLAEVLAGDRSGPTLAVQHQRRLQPLIHYKGCLRVSRRLPTQLPAMVTLAASSKDRDFRRVTHAFQKRQCRMTGSGACEDTLIAAVRAGGARRAPEPGGQDPDNREDQEGSLAFSLFLQSFEGGVRPPFFRFAMSAKCRFC